MITTIKNEIIKVICNFLDTNNYGYKITSDNFTEENRKIPASVCEINLQYIGSDWESVNDTVNYQKIQYNRTLNFNLFLRVKNLRTEDKAQDFNDFIIENLSVNPVFNRYLRIDEDEFEEYLEGFWIYRQSWSYTLNNLQPNPDCDNNEYDFSAIEILISPSYTHPVTFDPNKASKIDQDNYQ